MSILQQDVVHLSHSARESYITCPKKYYYHYVKRLSSTKIGAQLGFGNAVHTACAVYLSATVTGAIVDPVSVFLREWKQFITCTATVTYGKFTPESLEETGVALVKAFMEYWPTSGFTVIVDIHGKPVVERRLKLKLPGNVIFTTINDLLAITNEGLVAVLDLKTPAQLAIEGFASLSEQLLGYQVSGDAFAEELGIEQVDLMAFVELHKVTVKKPPKKADAKQPLQPRVAPVELVPRHSTEEVREWLQETASIANDIRAKRFPRRPGDSYNTPCGMCDFSNLCVKQSMEGLEVRKQRNVVVDTSPALAA